MSDEYHRTDIDVEAGSIGIGAMIVFIALILVAAVASTIIIKTAEELQQNAESTSDDTRKEISGKISVLQVLVNGSDGTDIDSLIVTAKVASGSMDVQVQDIDWLITCGGATYGLITGNLGTTDSSGGNMLRPESVNADYLSGADYAATDELDAGTTFKFDINLDLGDEFDAVDEGDGVGSSANAAGTGACATSAGVGEILEMKMVVDGGGTTILELQIESVTSGKEVT
jgi:flagellin FlaB